MNTSDRFDLAAALGAFDRVREIPVEDLPAILGQIERVKATLWHRLVLASSTPTRTPARDPVEELRHLTPQAAAQLLSLKPAYVHELCRTGRLPATKSGKYWMISVAALRQWLSPKGDVDGALDSRLQSLNPSGDTGRASRGVRARPTSARM